MLLARDGAGNLAQATPAARARCPGCDAGVIAKCGEIVSWHWAHERGYECDSWTEGESEWHLAYKRQALAMGCRVEVTMRDGNDWHRADVVRPDGIVVELQHSSLGFGQAQEREAFYRRHGGLVWLWDAMALGYWANVYTSTSPRTRGEPLWSRPSITISGLRSPMYWDVGGDLLAVRIAWMVEGSPALLKTRSVSPYEAFLGVKSIAMNCTDVAGHNLLWFGTWAGELRCRKCSPLTYSGEGFVLSTSPGAGVAP